MIDPFIAGMYRERTAKSWGAGIVMNAWQGIHPAQRAPMIYAQGDPQRAGSCDPNWQLLADGDFIGALKATRNQQSPFTMQLEAETLIAAGSLVAGLERLRRLHNRGLVSASLSLTRRLHMLGDFKGAVTMALSIPWHAHIVILGTRAAIMDKDYRNARKLIEPLLLGIVPVPDTENAAGLMLVTASLLVQTGEYERLQAFMRSVLMSMDLPDALLPAVARSAWMAGFGQQAWDKLSQQKGEFSAAACAELATLVGNVEIAQKWTKAAGFASAPLMPALKMLTGEVLSDIQAKSDANQIFKKGNEIHIWRTHPYRWEPWIRTAQATKAKIKVYDLSRADVPDLKAQPTVTMDDSALVEILVPEPLPTQARGGQSVWVAENLCRGFSVPLDWPSAETDLIFSMLERAPSQDQATLVVASAMDGAALATAGRPVVVIAPPGDPFWNGPLPKVAWPGMNIIKPHPEQGWKGAGMQVIGVAKELFKIMTSHLNTKPTKPTKSKAAAKKRPKKSNKKTTKKTTKPSTKN